MTTLTLPDGWRFVRRDGRVFAVHSRYGGTHVHPDTPDGEAIVIRQAWRADEFCRRVPPTGKGTV